MEQAIRGVRGGWREDEIALLWQEVSQATQTGASLRGVFDRMGERLGRKPNSVRNFYYMLARERPEGVRRGARFEVFSQEEVRDLLRHVLTARAQGESVRACVTRLAGGDRSLMLRYQNKYRAVLKKRPALVREVLDELQREGLNAADPYQTSETRAVALYENIHRQARQLQDADVLSLLSGLDALLTRAAKNETLLRCDRMRVRLDLLRMENDALRDASRALLEANKEILAQFGADACGSLPQCVSRLENELDGFTAVQAAAP